MTVPVIQEESSESKNTIAAATSSGRPTRLSGWMSPMACTCSTLIPRVAWIGVSTTPGMTALTRTVGAHSRASERLSWLRAALLAL